MQVRERGLVETGENWARRRHFGHEMPQALGPRDIVKMPCVNISADAEAGERIGVQCKRPHGGKHLAMLGAESAGLMMMQ